MEFYIKSAVEQLGLDKVSYYPGGEDAFGSVIPKAKKPRKKKNPPVSQTSVSAPVQNISPSQRGSVQTGQNWGLEPAAPKQVAPAQPTQSTQPIQQKQNIFNTESEPYNLVPTDDELQVASAPLDMLERNYHQVMQHVGVLAKQVHQDQQAALGLLQEFRNVRPAWKALREKIKVNPGYAMSLNSQSIEQANKAFEQVLPMIAQMAMESKQDAVQISQFMNAAKSALGLIGKFVNVTDNRKAAKSNIPFITAENASSSSVFS